MQVAKSAGDAIKQALDKAYDAITEEKMCAQICTASSASADAGAAVREAMATMTSAVQSACEQVQAAAALLFGRLGVAGPFDVACDTCKGLVAKTKTWLKDNQVQHSLWRQRWLTPLVTQHPGILIYALWPTMALETTSQQLSQKDVRDFMYKKCEQMKAPEDVNQCKETADQVADQVEAAAQAVIDSLDEGAACSLFCPPPPSAALAFGDAGASRKFASQ